MASLEGVGLGCGWAEQLFPLIRSAVASGRPPKVQYVVSSDVLADKSLPYAKSHAAVTDQSG